ncbi:MAG: hypothetical protein J4G19_07685 [Pseudomonadales bacterium]|nr:hypothetical protein [Pseudomonadales bacterium]
MRIKIGRRLVNHIHAVHPLLVQFGFGTSLAIVSLLVWPQSFAESTTPLIDDRCEFLKSTRSFDERASSACDNEMNSCIEDRISQHAEPRDQAKEHCWYRPLTIDPRFAGPCPMYMAQLEADANDDRESLLQRLNLRSRFKELDEFGAPVEWFKRRESENSIRHILSTQPDYPVALRILRSSLLYSDDDVEQLKLDLKIQELDPDCPNSRNMFLNFSFGITSEIVDNWLSSEGSGSELSKSEIRALFLRVQRTLLTTYDVAIDQSESEGKLYFALASVDDAILSLAFENLQQFARRIEIGLADYSENRRTSLVQRFSREFDVDSDHGRSQSLSISCSNQAFELGLLDHCFKLLTYFGREDSNSSKSPALDWSRAAISLMNAVTRDCSAHTEIILHAPNWWNQRRCLEEQRAMLAANVSELLGKFSYRETSAEANVLDAYLHMDESSDEWFLRALEMNDATVVYAAPLSKRLHRMGYLGTATNILSGIEFEIEGKLTSSEKQLLSRTSTSVLEGIYKNWIESFVDF